MTTPAEKPAILQDTRFTVREGFAYRALRTGAIWLNKLFFSSLALLGVWILWAALGGETDCVSHEEGQTCSVLLTPTAKFLGAMAILSFLLSILSGALGLVVGKEVLAAAPAAEEVGARRPAAPAEEASREPGEVHGRGP